MLFVVCISFFFIVFLFYRSCENYALKRFCFDVFSGFVLRFIAPFSNSGNSGLVVADSAFVCLRKTVSFLHL